MSSTSSFPARAPEHVSSASRTPRLAAFAARRRLTLRVGRLALLAAVAALLIAKIPGLGAVRSRFADARLGWVGVAGLCELGTVVGFVLAFYAAFGRRVRLALSASLGMVAQAVNVLVPAGGGSGLALMGVVMARAGIPVRFTATRMIALFILTSMAVDLLLVMVGGVGVATGVLPGSVPWEASLIPAAVAVLVASGIVLLPRGLPLRESAPPAGRRSAFVNTLRCLREGIEWSVQLMRSRDPLLAIGSLAYVLLDLAALAAAFHAMGAAGLPLGTMLLAYTLGQAGSVIPFPGATESGMVGVLVLYGAPLALSAAAVLVYRAAQSVVPLALGAVGLASLSRQPVEAGT